MLTAGEHARIHEFVRLTLDWLEQRGFVLTVESDMRAWADLMRSSPRIVGVNPTYDPDQSCLTPANAFWLRLQQNGRTIACSANRFFATDDLLGLIRSMQIWHDAKPLLLGPPYPVVVPPSFPRVAGNVGHSGGLWVHPDFRGQGLSRILPRLIRVLALRHFDEDWHSTLVNNSLLESGIPRNAYGYTRWEKVIDSYVPLLGRHETVWLGLMDREEMFACLAGDIDWLGTESDDQVRHAVATG